MEKYPMNTDLDIQQCYRYKDMGVRLMARWLIRPHASPDQVVEIRRGMVIVTLDGCVVGKMAAVALYKQDEQAACLILSRLPEQEGYQSLPGTWVAEVEDGRIILNVESEIVRGLPGWHAG